jgi:hypothetical protein
VTARVHLWSERGRRRERTSLVGWSNLTRRAKGAGTAGYLYVGERAKQRSGRRGETPARPAQPLFAEWPRCKSPGCRLWASEAAAADEPHPLGSLGMYGISSSALPCAARR